MGFRVYGIVDHAERPSDPKTRVKPHIWKWHDIYDSLLQAKEIDRRCQRQRRAAGYSAGQSGLGESEMTSHTILLSFQLIQPGEVAPAHRHTMSAFRFILQGRGAYTNVDGQKMAMEDGDLILTPGGCWHEHAHEGDDNMVWIDGLDVPFIQALNQISFDPIEVACRSVKILIRRLFMALPVPSLAKLAKNRRCCIIIGAIHTRRSQHLANTSRQLHSMAPLGIR